MTDRPNDEDFEITRGPLGWWSWQLAAAGQVAEQMVEFTLYGDSAFTGELRAFGPFDILNGLGPGARTSVASRPVAVLRARVFEETLRNEITTSTQTGAYYGMELPDEVGSLISLALGRRVRNGGPTRMYFENDALGAPVGFSHAIPYLPHRVDELETLPLIRGEAALEDALDVLQQYQQLDAAQALAFSKAAFSYARAIWIADDNPEEAWLRLVTAVESVANLHYADANNLDDLRLKILDVVTECARDEQAELELRNQLVPLFGSLKKFRSLCLNFLPEPPVRQPQVGALDWSKMKRHLDTIYDIRSKALHVGVPVPSPMCSPPAAYCDDGLLSEVPLAPVASQGGHWMPKDVPMLLQTFERIVRGVLLNWLRAGSKRSADQ